MLKAWFSSAIGWHLFDGPSYRYVLRRLLVRLKYCRSANVGDRFNLAILASWTKSPNQNDAIIFRFTVKHTILWNFAILNNKLAKLKRRYLIQIVKIANWICRHNFPIYSNTSWSTATFYLVHVTKEILKTCAKFISVHIVLSSEYMCTTVIWLSRCSLFYISC